MHLFEYLKWRGDLSFNDSEQNEIDGLIFSELSYIPFDEIVPSILDEKEGKTLENVSKEFFDSHGENFSLGLILPKEILILLKECAKTERFKDVKLWGYRNEVSTIEEKQFSALCFSCSNDITYVVYRGTDDTIIGWKEDLNMALFTPIPAQKDGVEFLDSVSSRTRDKIIISGHSKGGNIAIYSALNASKKAKKKILGVFSYDGPGFKEEFIRPYEKELIVEKIKTFLPTKSVVGRIFDIIGDYEIIKSSDRGVQQHNAFTWLIAGKKFETADSFEKPSDNFHDLLKVWVSKMTPEQRHEFVDSFYKIATASDASTLTDIINKKFKFLIGLIKTEGNNKKVVIDAIFKLIKEKNAINSANKKAEKNEKNTIKAENKRKALEIKKQERI